MHLPSTATLSPSTTSLQERFAFSDIRLLFGRRVQLFFLQLAFVCSLAPCSSTPNHFNGGSGDLFSRWRSSRRYNEIMTFCKSGSILQLDKLLNSRRKPQSPFIVLMFNRISSPVCPPS